MAIRDIYCQDKAVGFLQSAMRADKIAHSYIFAGKEGVGKFTAAKEWAKLILCKDKTDEDSFFDSCGMCESCRAFDTENHPDFFHIYKELKRLTKKGRDTDTPIDISIDVIREFLIDKIAVQPTLSKSAVYVISESEKLNAESQNALLKALEEPPSFCFIILLCTRMDKLLPTIRSRSQIVRFGTIDEEKIVSQLAEAGIDDIQGRYWARLTDGSIGQSLTSAKLMCGQKSFYEVKKQIVSKTANAQLGDALELASEFLEAAKTITEFWCKQQKDTSKADIKRRVEKQILMMLASAVNDAAKMHIGQEEKIVNFEQKNDIAKLAQKIDIENGSQIVECAFECCRWIDASVNDKLAFERLLLNLYSCDTMAGL